MKTQLVSYLLLLFIISCHQEPINYAEHEVSAISNETFKDIDGNVYHTVIIGLQIWMVENLRTTRYSDGASIPNISNNNAWNNNVTGAYCNYNNTAASAAIYGRLYNWYAVNNAHKLAPNGWHIPSREEWEKMINLLGEFQASGKLKEAGLSHWLAPNYGANNSTGFTALPNGRRFKTGQFGLIGEHANWWSTNQYVNPYYPELGLYFSWGPSLNNVNYTTTNSLFVWKGDGLAVRCIKNSLPHR